MSIKDCSTYASLRRKVDRYNSEVKDAQREFERITQRSGIPSATNWERDMAIEKIEKALGNQKEAIGKMNEHVRNCPICQNRN
jgi:superfamily II DNA helicase RecQ